MRICVQVPLYHCFGSVLAGMCMAVNGVTLVFPAAGYDSKANLQAIQDEKYGTLLVICNSQHYELSLIVFNVFTLKVQLPVWHSHDVHRLG